MIYEKVTIENCMVVFCWIDMCEIPVYLETKCDHKRNVLYQRSSKKQINKKPIPVYIKECLYWIGFHNSSRIISHMMSLMEDNRKSKIMSIKNNYI
ncbi:hypothetical protein ACFW04_007649 [Cataglyphis niger]